MYITPNSIHYSNNAHAILFSKKIHVNRLLSNYDVTAANYAPSTREQNIQTDFRFAAIIIRRTSITRLSVAVTMRIMTLLLKPYVYRVFI